jgi:small-conductance mechanosensitive channel
LAGAARRHRVRGDGPLLNFNHETYVLLSTLVALVAVWGATWLVERALVTRVRGLPGDLAAFQTRVRLGKRIVRAFAFIFGLLVVLGAYPETQNVASAVLASGAVLALVVGLAVQRPLSNLGAGIQLAFSQPIRLGDRVTVGQETGFVDAVTLTYTVIRTDDNRRVFYPNAELISSPVSNSTIDDVTRAVTVRLPVRLGADLDRAKEIARAAAENSEFRLADRPVSVHVVDASHERVELEVAAWAGDLGAAGELASEVREHALRGLAEERLLPEPPCG